MINTMWKRVGASIYSIYRYTHAKNFSSRPKICKPCRRLTAAQINRAVFGSDRDLGADRNTFITQVVWSAWSRVNQLSDWIRAGQRDRFIYDECLCPYVSFLLCDFYLTKISVRPKRPSVRLNSVQRADLSSTHREALQWLSGCAVINPLSLLTGDTISSLTWPNICFACSQAELQWLDWLWIPVTGLCACCWKTKVTGPAALGWRRRSWRLGVFLSRADVSQDWPMWRSVSTMFTDSTSQKNFRQRGQMILPASKAASLDWMTAILKYDFGLLFLLHIIYKDDKYARQNVPITLWKHRHYV